MPFGEYENFEDCVAKNQDKENPEAYCAAIKKKVEGELSVPEPYGARSLSVSLKPVGVQVSVERDGGYVRGVTLLSPGTWTDSGVGTPLHYGEKVLSAYAENWSSTGLWGVHSGGMHRRITDKVGQIQNPRFENGVLKGDLYFHMRTQESRDSFEMIKAGIEGVTDPVSFSVEHNGREVFDPQTRTFEATSLEFYGGALVDVGASGGTKILSKLQVGIKEELQAVESSIGEPLLEGGNIMDEETKKELEALGARLTALENAGKPREAEKPAEPKEEPKPAEKPEFTIPEALTNEVKTLSAKVGDLERKVVELSKQPAPRELAVVSAKPDIPVTRVMSVSVNKKTGTIEGRK